MAKRPKPGLCVHCLQRSDKLSWDHVFPMSWYPGSTSTSEEKWKIPSCIPCNEAYGRLEHEFLLRVGLCLDPDDAASKSIVEKVMRAVRPSSARSDRDRMARAAKQRSILADLLEGAEIPREATYPGMGERWDRPLKDQVAVTIPVEYVQRMAEKIVRGIFYIEDAKLIEPPFVVEHFAAHEESMDMIRNVLARFGKSHARPPGIVVRRAVVPEDGLSSLFEIIFWQQFKAYATVLSSAR